MGSSKYCTTRKNTQLYYITKRVIRLIRYIYIISYVIIIVIFIIIIIICSPLDISEYTQALHHCSFKEGLHILQANDSVH